MTPLLLLISAAITISFGQILQRRYIIDNDSDTGDNVALPIDVCFKNKVQGTTYLKYTCNGANNQVTKTEYSDAACTAPTTTTSVTWTSSAQTPCAGQDKFNCIGTDEYVMTGVYAATSASCTNFLASTELPAVLGCYCDSSTSSYTADCTSSSSGSINKWGSSTQCSNTVTTAQSLDTCYEAFTYSYSGMDIPISVQITDCILASSTPAPSSGGSTPSPLPAGLTNAPTQLTTASPASSPNTDIFGSGGNVDVLFVYYNILFTALVLTALYV